VAAVISAVSIVPAVVSSSEKLVSALEFKPCTIPLFGRTVSVALVIGLASFDFFEKKKNRRRLAFFSTFESALLPLVVSTILRRLFVFLLFVTHGEDGEYAGRLFLVLFTGLDWELAIFMF